MRVRRGPFVVVAFAATVYSAHGQPVDPTTVLAAARDALGGEKSLSAVKTFTATGRTRQVRGNNLVPIEFEINCELPDKFVRTDEIPTQDTDPTTLGFNGDELIQFPALPPGGGRGSSPVAPAGRATGALPPPDVGRSGGLPLTVAQQRLVTVKQDFVRLTLGMFATSFASYPLTFRYAGLGEAPEGQADVLDVAGPANFSARFVVQRATHLPVMLMWQVPATTVVFRMPGQALPNPLPPGAVVADAPPPPADGASQEDRTQYATTIATLRRQALAQGKPVEYRVYYSDFRTVNGLRWPFRIKQAIGSETIEETTFDRIRINARIDPKKFETSK